MKETAQDKALIVSIGDVPQFSALSKKFEKPRNVPYNAHGVLLACQFLISASPFFGKYL